MRNRVTVTGPNFKICVLNASDYLYDLSMARYRRTRRSRRPLRRSRRRPRRSFVRRRGGRRGITRRQKPNVSLGYLVPRKCSMITKYSSTMASGTSSATYQEHIWTATSVYDPDSAIGGHQAMLFDQMMAMYNKFFVSASKISIELYPTKTSANIDSATSQYGANGTVYLFCNTNGSNMSPLDSRFLREQPNIKWKKWGNSGLGGVPGNNTLSAYVKNSAIQPGWKISNPDTWGSIAGNPLVNNWWHIYIESSDLQTFLAYNYRVTMTYYVTYFTVDDFIPGS